MTKPQFNHPDKFQEYLWADWLRHNLPLPTEGWVREDLDLVVRIYANPRTPRYLHLTDNTGKLMLIELKYGNAQPGFAQNKTFGLINDLCRAGDPHRLRYRGYYVLNYTNEDWDKAVFKLNNFPISQYDWLRFLEFEDIPGLPPFPWEK